MLSPQNLSPPAWPQNPRIRWFGVRYGWLLPKLTLYDRIHTTIEMCTDINFCMTISTGPNFVSLNEDNLPHHLIWGVHAQEIVRYAQIWPDLLRTLPSQFPAGLSRSSVNQQSGALDRLPPPNLLCTALYWQTWMQHHVIFLVQCAWDISTPCP